MVGGREIPLTRGFVALVDDEDFERVSALKWTASGGRAWHYTSVNGKPRSQQISRLILDAPAHLEVDHIDGDPLNNQRANLRLCTRAQNAANRAAHGKAPYKGIRPSGRGWEAQLSSKRQTFYLGTFATPEDAARAYDSRAKQMFGEFARLNFPGEAV